MKLEHYPVEKMKKEISGIVAKYLNLKDYKIFFFGSRVTGENSERADIDIAIRGPQAVPLATMAKIEEEIDNLPTLYKIDVVDFQTVSPEFRQVASQKIEMIE